MACLCLKLEHKIFWIVCLLVLREIINIVKYLLVTIYACIHCPFIVACGKIVIEPGKSISSKSSKK